MLAFPYGTVWKADHVRLPEDTHTSRPWRIHEIAGDFRIEDVWQLPTPGGAEDFRRLVEAFADADPEENGPAIVRWLFAVRWKLGELFGWDDADDGLGARVPTLRDRVPADLRDSAAPVDFRALPFAPLFLRDDEFAGEIANRTMHGILHLGWVPDGTGRYRGQMAVLVKPNGTFGRLYMAAIRPFRHWLVYPPMLRHIERAWREADASSAPTPPAA